MQSALHRADGNRQNLSSLTVFQTLEINQHNHLFCRGRQGVDRMVQGVVLLRRFGIGSRAQLAVTTSRNASDIGGSRDLFA